jgi:hypothetical protein
MNLNMIRKLPSDQNFNRKLQLSDPNYDERGGSGISIMIRM